MSRQHHVEAVLSELAKELDMAAINLDSSDRATIAFDDVHLTLLYQAEPLEALWLYIDLGCIAEDDNDATAFLLQVGVGSWVTGRMTIGLDEDGRTIRGFAVLPISCLDRPTLQQLLIEMLELALPLRRRLEQRDFRVDSFTDEAPATGLNPVGIRV